MADAAGEHSRSELRDRLAHLKKAALDPRPIKGLTHRFYRYPARFSPTFTATAIEAFSKPGDLVLDPYMGGGTSIVEAFARGRRAVGCDLNALALFVTRLKTTPLSRRDVTALVEWADRVIPSLSYHDTPADLHRVLCSDRTRNLSLPQARPHKKLIGLALRTIEDLPSVSAQSFARGAILGAGQWALNGRHRQSTLAEFRGRIRTTLIDMLDGLAELVERLRDLPGQHFRPTLIQDSAANIQARAPFVKGQLADMVVASPPYPGIHVLYHRWQVDGRSETPAPYWIANCRDGRGSAFYNFADRREPSGDVYFGESLKTLKSIRAVSKPGAVMVQMLAFAQPQTQLPRYLENMKMAGFTEVRLDTHLGEAQHRRVWRDVPGRRWHAQLRAAGAGAREVVLVHSAT